MVITYSERILALNKLWALLRCSLIDLVSWRIFSLSGSPIPELLLNEKIVLEHVNIVHIDISVDHTCAIGSDKHKIDSTDLLLSHFDEKDGRAVNH